MLKSVIKFIPAICLILFMGTITAQEYDYDYDHSRSDKDTKPLKVKKDRKFDKSKMSVGGFGGFGFSGDFVFLDLSPIVAYRVIEKMQIGVGVTYQYQNLGDYYKGSQYEHFNKVHLYGGQIFDRFFIWKNLFAQIQYNVLNTEWGEYRYELNGAPHYTATRKTFHTVFGGGGYNVPIGLNSFLSLMLMINLNENDLYPNRQPHFNLGFGIGL